MKRLCGLILPVLLIGAGALNCLAVHSTANVEEIIQKSVAANQRDFEAAPKYSYQETDRTGASSKTYQVLMIDGSPYNRLIAENGSPISSVRDQEEQRKLAQATSQRRSESQADREKRIAKYQQERRRDHAMLQQLTVAFDFKLLGQHKSGGFQVYVLRATPKPGYKPPNMETQVLPAMHGELWVDERTFDWVKVTAEVTHPVSIEGFLAEVEPGTRFELEKRPVGDGIWLPSHFAMASNAKVLHLFHHNSEENDTFSDYKRVQ
ncbi:MAG TPA: hypothetical protein VH325_14290 [Bryobacteraceae bacterium]|nr:hypothetical protein [Bryobacteraceae bacterium]